MKKIVFFDINGTLIERDSRTDLPFMDAIDDTLGIKDSMVGINSAARSDKDVFMEVLNRSNIAFTDAIWEELLKNYIIKLEAYKDSDIWRENVDAISCVHYLSKKQIPLALITGELSLGAKYKLEKLGIWHYFATGGFGEDGLHRFDIAKSALNKANALYNTAFDEIFVVGDTLLDIDTARHIGAKIISIDTGANTRAELSSMNPDYIISRYLSSDGKGLIEQLFD